MKHMFSDEVAEIADLLSQACSPESSDGGAYARGQAAQRLISLILDFPGSDSIVPQCRRALAMLAEGNVDLTRIMVDEISEHLPEDPNAWAEGGAFGMTKEELIIAGAKRTADQAAYAAHIAGQGCTEPPESLTLMGSYAQDDPEAHFRYADMFYEMREILDDPELPDLKKLEQGLIQASEIFAEWSDPERYQPFAQKTTATARAIIEHLLNNNFRLARELSERS